MKRTMKRAIAMILSLLLLLTAATALGEAEEGIYLMDELDTVDLDGAKVDSSILEDYDLTMVNIWATYCGPCLNEMPYLGTLAVEWAEKGVQIVGLVSDVLNADLTADAQKVRVAQALVEKTGANYPHLIPDEKRMNYVIAGIPGVPTTFFVNREGMLVGEVIVGMQSEEVWNQVIAETLAKYGTAKETAEN